MHTFVAAGQPKRSKTSNDSKNIMREYGADLSLRSIWTMKRQTRSTGSDDLLFLGAGELAQYCVGDCGGGLYGQRVHEHGRRRRHFGGREPRGRLGGSMGLSRRYV
jgi:hypothetical protein